MNGSEAEALVIRRQRSLQFLVVDEAASVLIRNLEARHYAGVRARRKRRRNQRRERAPVRRRWRIASSAAALGVGPLLRWFAVRSGVGSGRLAVGGGAVGLARRRSAVGLAGRWGAVGLRRRRSTVL